MPKHIHVRDPITGRCPECDAVGGHASIVKRTGEDPHGGGYWRNIQTPVRMGGYLSQHMRRSPSPALSVRRSPSPAAGHNIPMIYSTPPTPEFDDSQIQPTAITRNGNPIYIQIQPPPPPQPPPQSQPAPPVIKKTREIEVQTTERTHREAPAPVYVVNLPESAPPTPEPPPPPTPPPQPQVIFIDVPEKRKKRPLTPKPAPTPPPPPPPPPPPQTVYVERPKKVKAVAPTRARTPTTVYQPVKRRPNYYYTPRSYSTAGSKALEVGGRKRCLCCCLTGSILALLLAGAIMGLVMWRQNVDYREAIPQPRNFWIVPDYTDCTTVQPAGGAGAPTPTTASGCMRTVTMTAEPSFTRPGATPAPTSGAYSPVVHVGLGFHFLILFVILYF